MCLIIQAEPEYAISKELMDNFAKRNKDGFGVMWIDDNKIHAKKFGPDEMDQLYATYQSLKHQRHYIHLRMRTHGTIDEAMAHPYYCGHGIWLMHNGVLPTNGQDTSKSDTWHFINDVLAPLFKVVDNPHTLIRSAVFANIMKQYLSTSNRIVMGDRGGYIIFNNSQWHKIYNQNTGVVGMLVSNTYAWDADSYGRPVYTPPSYSRNHHNKWRQAQLLSEEADDHATDTAASLTSREEKFQAQIKDLFKQIGRHWYINREGKVFKRNGFGFRRRHDLDEDDQFWNSFPADHLVTLSVWVAGFKDVDQDGTPSSIITPEEVKPPVTVITKPHETGVLFRLPPPKIPLPPKGRIIIDGQASVIH